MSDTPRTDAAVRVAANLDTNGEEVVVAWNFARTLERELAARPEVDAPKLEAPSPERVEHITHDEMVYAIVDPSDYEALWNAAHRSRPLPPSLLDAVAWRYRIGEDQPWFYCGHNPKGDLPEGWISEPMFLAASSPQREPPPA